ncbi:MAG: lysylphosphatidylglycerol synthase transmembrane domain-containing protein [Bacteroidota bacterium]|nr:lysylphosphatidylglycerol synthase transmembrane domain-containing protein [Bacteroidota bacterium]
MNRRALSSIAIALATLGLLYLAFRGQDIAGSLHAIGDAHFFPLLGGVMMMFLSHAVRAFRWQIVLRPLKRSTSFWRAYRATLAGYGMNNLIPRSGEIVRPYLMSRGENIPMAGALASVVVERLADVMALAVLMIFSLWSFGTRLTSVFPMFSGDAIILLGVMLAALILFILMFFSERRTLRFVDIFVKRLPGKLSARVEKIAIDFSHGLRGLDRSAILPLVIGTAGIWLIYGVSMWVSLQGFDAAGNLTFGDALLLLTLSGIAYTIPTPGATGSYHALIKTGLALIFGVPASIALAYAIATHILSYITITLAGLGVLVAEGLSFDSARKLGDDPAPDTQHSALMADG